LPEQPTAIALWTLHTWLFNAFDYTVYLFIYSASMRSGKTRVLEVLELLCRNPEMTPGASAAALIRSGDEENPPTLLLDEMDTVYSKRNDTEAENTRRFLNAGYKRGARFLKCVGQGTDISVKKFPAFCPKALAGIDRCLPDTVMDRSLPIELIRQSRGERAERLRDREAKAITAPLRDELQALAQEPGIIEALRSARPIMPVELHDRAQDISEPLIAIADMAGGEWPEKARAALVKLFDGNEEESDIHVRLLADIKRVFDESGADKLFTRAILERLVANADDAPWPLWFEESLKHDRHDSAASKLARKLKRYGIKPGQIRVGDETGRGYQRSQYEKCWERYLPAPTPPSQAGETSETSETKPDFMRENPCFTSIDTRLNVSPTEKKSETQNYEGKTQNVSPVKPVSPNPDEQEEPPPGTVSRDHTKHHCDTCTNGKWHLCDACEAEFNAGRDMHPGGCPEWIKLYLDDTHPDWLPVLKRALAKPCEVCGEPLGDESYLWLHCQTNAVHCPNCRETSWWSDGYEIDEYGNPSCWNLRYTPEQRIAERDLAMLERATKEWKKSDEGMAELQKARLECARLGVRPHRYGQQAKGLTPGQFVAEATALFNATPVTDGEAVT
jgi:hypothetical protein